MAIAKAKKIELIGHVADREQILKTLEEAAILQVKTKEETIAPGQISLKLKEQSEHIHEQLSKTDFLLKLLNQFYKPKANLIDSFIPPKLAAKKADYETVLQTLPIDDLYGQMEALDVELRQLDNDIKEALDTKELLEPWRKLDFAPVKETTSTKIFIATLTTNRIADFVAKLQQDIPSSVVQIVDSISALTYFVLFIYKSDEQHFLEIVQKHGVSLTQLPKVTGSVAQNLKTIDQHINEWQREKAALVNRIQELTKHRKKLVISKVFLSNQLAKIELQERILHTENVFVLEGWIKASDAIVFENLIKKQTNSYALNIADPAGDEKPPVILKNPRWLKPFEAVTALYGMPSYGELDPTPYMAPFFLIFFGLAIGDVVYGFALATTCWLLKKSNRFSSKAKTFLTLFIYGGVSAIFFGLITGSWLTLESAFLPSFLKKFIIFDPVTQPTLFLVITLILGLVQIYFGLILKFVNIAREQTLIKAIQIQLPPLLLLPGVALLAAKVLGLELSSTLNIVAVYLSLGGALGVVLFSEPEAKGILSRLGSGLYNLYGMSSFLGDTISYARIMALGLATFLIGSSINSVILGSAVIKTLFIKILLAVLILPVVHVFNLAINTIGAFVHPARLQYIEFFGKFFEGGGRRFKPLEVKTDNITLE